MKFKYERVGIVPCPAFPSGHTTLRPIILVTLEHNGVERRYKALVDSGADFCIFHSLMGELLGLDVEAGKEARFTGIGGSGMIAYFHTIHARVGEYSYEIDCGFTREISADGHGVLGQIGFFDHFQIRFDYKAEEIEITPRQ